MGSFLLHCSLPGDSQQKLGAGARGVQIFKLSVFGWIFICGSLRVFLPHDEDSHASSFQSLVSDTSVDAFQGSSSQPVSRNPFQGSCLLPPVFLSDCGHLTLKVDG